MKLSDIEQLALTLPAEDFKSQDGTPFVTRYTLRKASPGAAYLQRIYREDRDPAPHSHPWQWMSATILHGGYTHRWGVVEGGVAYREIGVRGYRPGEGYSLGAEHVHRIVMVMPLTWTLLLVGPKREQDWAFFVDDHWVTWQKRFAERGVK